MRNTARDLADAYKVWLRTRVPSAGPPGRSRPSMMVQPPCSTRSPRGSPHPSVRAFTWRRRRGACRQHLPRALPIRRARGRACRPEPPSAANAARHQRMPNRVARLFSDARSWRALVDAVATIEIEPTWRRSHCRPWSCAVHATAPAFRTLAAWPRPSGALNCSLCRMSVTVFPSPRTTVLRGILDGCCASLREGVMDRCRGPCSRLAHQPRSPRPDLLFVMPTLG